MPIMTDDFRDIFRITNNYIWAGVYNVSLYGKETPFLKRFTYLGKGEWWPRSITSGPYKNCSRMPVGMPVGFALPYGDIHQLADIRIVNAPIALLTSGK